MILNIYISSIQPETPSLCIILQSWLRPFQTHHLFHKVWFLMLEKYNYYMYSMRTDHMNNLWFNLNSINSDLATSDIYLKFKYSIVVGWERLPSLNLCNVVHFTYNNTNYIYKCISITHYLKKEVLFYRFRGPFCMKGTALF